MSGLREERAEERICLVRRLYDRGMNSTQISELIGLDKEQVEEMLQTKSILKIMDNLVIIRSIKWI